MRKPVLYFCSLMNALITVFKSEFTEKQHLIPILLKMANEVKELNDAYIFRPIPGGLMRFLTLLKEKNISYGTHFDTVPE